MTFSILHRESTAQSKHNNKTQEGISIVAAFDILKILVDKISVPESS